MFCYALAPVVIVASRRLPLRRFLTAAGAVVGLTIAIRIGWSLFDGASFFLYMNPALRLGEFVVGVMVATQILNGWRPRIPLPAAVGVAAAMLFALGASRNDLPGAVPELVMLPVFVCVLIAAAAADLRGARASSGTGSSSMQGSCRSPSTSCTHR